MTEKNDPHAWLDPIIDRNKRLHGGWAAFIEAAAEAEELFTPDELEQEAARLRQLEAESKEEPKDE